ncbi:pyrimidine 5'-nucleotidase [Pantoea stewartii subsp. indologenes]|uniref:pyrimidine 5'-nucleotidase n=1 Tax=Pantoea stewartii TaxID=66269 RepID=UPI00197E6D49|nr:pyrimidine 5'-nucleotidase [Pantoea stewartii]MDK2634187.1 pyrimidine 5'-nucleotidase [Pantoea stewartii subsp. indologenes]
MLDNWDCILFDADDTLFHFDSYAGLQRLFAGYDVRFTDQDFADYQAVNKPLWVEYQNGQLSALELQTRRFAGWGQKLSVAPAILNDGFLSAMAEICLPLEGADSLMTLLHGRVKMGIITNGFTALQQRRLERTGFLDYFSALVVSEEVGVPKPDARIFDYALAQLGNPPRDRVLMVGDTPESDILGGMNAGIKTCWVDHGTRPLPDAIKPDWRVNTLSELDALLRG